MKRSPGFRAGNSGVLDVIDAMRYAEAQLGLSQAESQHLLDTTQLYLVLGHSPIATTSTQSRTNISERLGRVDGFHKTEATDLPCRQYGCGVRRACGVISAFFGSAFLDGIV
jgi:hypothetical protein